jgi:hypothetical protein
MERDILIGIDASLVSCGIAILQDGKLELHTAEILDAIKWLSAKKILSRSIAVIEDPNLDKNVFGQFVLVKAAVLKFAGKAVGQYGMKQTAGTMADVQGAFSIAMKRAQDIGQAKAAAKILISLFERAKVPVVRIAPSDRHRADKESLKANFIGVQMLSMPTKTNAGQFQQLTGYVGRSNEHNRDAATLIHGRTIKWALMQISIQK